MRIKWVSIESLHHDRSTTAVLKHVRVLRYEPVKTRTVQVASGILGGWFGAY